MNMKKLILSSIACLMAVSLIEAQEMKSVFIQMPDSLSRVLTKINREDCVDFLASGMKAEVTNRFNLSSELKKLTADYLLLQETPQCTVEMKLLPVNDSTRVVCVVRTITTPAADSSVAFFTTDWQPLPLTDYFLSPSADEFYLPTDSLVADSPAADTLSALRKEADITFLRFGLSADDLTLTATYTTPDYMGRESATRLKAYLRKEPIRYRWSEGMFRGDYSVY